MLEHLPFNPDVVDQLPEGYRQKLKVTEGRTAEDVAEALSLLDKQEAERREVDAERMPKVAPGDVDLPITEPPTVVSEQSDLRGQSALTGSDGQAGNGESKEGKESDAGVESHQGSSGDGEWGEKAVFKALLREYDAPGDEVVWLNENGDVGKGCDLVIKQNGQEVVFVEVKSRAELNPEWVSVTKTQWEFARKLHSEDGDEEYWFCVVPGAGTPDARIEMLKNPIEEWKRGERLAHPINLKVR